MAITVKYFASLAESVGKREELVEFFPGITPASIWQAINLSKPDNLLVAINLDYADFNSALKDGDEVAFFPPVTGG